jgi:hypothetical protein
MIIKWVYDNGFICCKEYPSLVLDIRVSTFDLKGIVCIQHNFFFSKKGDSAKGGAQVLLYKRKDVDNMNQQWQFEPYHQFQDALQMATTSVPLHKKEGFGQPRPGYAAEVGVPAELTKIPENNNIAGVGKNVDTTPTPTTNAPPRPDHKKPESLNQYGSFYDYPTQTAPPPPQPGQAPSAYPPPPPASGVGAYPPQPGQVPVSSAYTSQPASNAYPPLPPNHPAGAYNSDYVGSPPSSSGFPSSPSYQQPAAGFPQPPSSGYPGSPPQPSGFPQSTPGYPAPPLPGNHPSGYQQNDTFSAPPGGGGFYMPQAPNRQEQYGGYPSYPQ